MQDELAKTFSRQSSTSATVSPCGQAASATDVSPFRILTTNATRRLAVHRAMGSAVSDTIATPSVRSGLWLEGSFHFKGSRIRPQ